MFDLYLGIALMLCLCVAVGIASGKLYQRIPKAGKHTLLALILLGIPGIWFFNSDNTLLMTIVPLSGIITFSNASPILAAALSGIIWTGVPGGPIRKGFSSGLLLITGFGAAYVPILTPAPPTRDWWQGTLCRQTTDSTCSAASAATLLKHYGIDTTEKEMANLCRTTTRGTVPAGVFRGLKLQTADTDLRVRVEKLTLDELRNTTFPALISVGLPRVHDLDPRYESKWGWTPGVLHSVVLFGFPDETSVDIGDPSVGRERWDVTGIQDLWTGQVIRLER